MSSEEMRKVKELYELYGFTVDKEENNYYIFVYCNGYFDNAEVVYFDKIHEDINTIELEYQEMGYSVRSIKYESLQQTHNLLFKGFFDIDKINLRLKKEYKAFCDLQKKKLLNSSYEYVVPAYSWNNDLKKDSLTQDIINQLNCQGAQLIILEAAAGYGKTCTSYEIINSISASNDNNSAPIFTELSKNRKATLFRYVLLDEIDKKFSSLSSKLVIREIENGNVPLIIDGFDELISRSNKNMTNRVIEQDDEAQTMLDTIAELFTEGCNCKVVLTSRKSSIFTGEVFDEWAKQKLKNCTITRVAISEPTIYDWIGSEKTKFLEGQKIPFSSIVNPILLSFMRCMDMDVFKKYCSDVESVISYYFDSLLDRERERQSLQLTVEEQYGILKKLANNFVEYEIKSEEISFIRDLFIEIIHEKFVIYKERYLNVEEKPTEEEFATKLAGHALLNRISSMKNDIGFINDFIFGIFIGEILIENTNIINNINIEYIDIACTAYASRSDDEKEKLFSVVWNNINKCNYEQQLDIEIKLTSTIKRNYCNHCVSNYFFGRDVYFDGQFYFEKCTFVNCTFEECIIMTSAFNNCSFYNCRFYKVVVERDTYKNCKLIFGGNCIGHETFMNEAIYEGEDCEKIDYEKVILRKYWSENERYSKGRVKEVVLLKSNNQEDRDKLEVALENLKRRDFISKDGHYWYINKDKIVEIKTFLEK